MSKKMQVFDCGPFTSIQATKTLAVLAAQTKAARYQRESRIPSLIRSDGGPYMAIVYCEPVSDAPGIVWSYKFLSPTRESDLKTASITFGFESETEAINAAMRHVNDVNQQLSRE